MTAGTEEPTKGAVYNRLLQRFRLALELPDLPGVELCDRDRRVARVMLEFASFSVFLNSGGIACWIGVETLALCLRKRWDQKADRTKVQRAHRALRKAGVLEVKERGGGRGRTTIHAFSQAWLDRVTAEVEKRGPAAIRAKLRPLGSGSVAFSDRAFGGSSAAVSAAYVEEMGAIGGTDAALSLDGAALSPAMGGTDAAVFDESAALSAAYGSTSAAIYGQGAAVFPAMSGIGAAVSEQDAAVSAGNSSTGAAVSGEGAALSEAGVDTGDAVVSPVTLNGGRSEAVSALPGRGFGGKGGSGDSKRAAPVQPEIYDSKSKSTDRPFQRSMMLPISGGKSVGTAAAEERARTRALQAVESDGRFEKLRETAARLLGGDVRLANLAISVMDEKLKRQILRGFWPETDQFRAHLRQCLDTIGAQVERSIAPAESAVPPPPIETGESRLDRVERMASETAAEVRQLSSSMAEFMALIRAVIPGNGTAAA